MTTTTKRFLTESRPISLFGETASETAIQIDPPEIKFMSVNPGTLYVMTFSVRNMTKVAQRIRIQAPKSACFALNYIPSGPVAPDGALEDMTFDFSAQVIEQKLTLVTRDKKGLLDMASFGNTFFGQTKTIEALLVNSGPQALNFSMSYEDEEEGGGVLSASASGNMTDDQIYAKCITVSPLEGTIKGFSQGFLKQHLIETKDERQISRKLVIDCPEMDQKIPLTMQGSAVTASVKVTPTTLRFGDCPINDRRDILMTITNGTKFVTNFSFPTIANFKFNPNSGVLQSLQTVSVIGSFLPPQLGTFKNTVRMSIADGLDSIEVRLMGESSDVVKKVLIGGTDKQPEDFAVRHKFVDPEVEEATRLEKRKAAEQKALLQTTLTNKISNMTLGGDSDNKTVSSTNSFERDILYGTGNGATSEEVKALPANYLPLDATHPHFQRKEHFKKYDAYLRDSHILREEKVKKEIHTRKVQRGCIDLDDPFSVNMGIDRGLDEPVIKLPAAGEPLWLANRQSRDGASGGPNRLPIDENRLINKKYSSTPATQAEIRDCTAELSVEQLKLVFGSHKVIDFGKVSVGSSAAKNFVVSNDLTQSVMVTLEDLELELAQSKPNCQIIPQSCIAGFDIYFSSKSIGKYKKAFTWKINGLHVSKVFVVADVVPIELIMNKQNLIMEFPEDLLQQTLSQEIVLSNPGNAPAEFLWGSAGAFMCSPEKGSIGAGKSTLGITVSPEQDFIPPGETIPLEIYVTPKFPMSTSVVPLLQVQEPSFAFGSVAIGSEIRLPLTIINKTGILSTLLLDLTNYPDFKPFIRGVLDEIEISTQEIPFEQEDAHAKQYSFKLQLYLQGIQENRSLNRDVTAVGLTSLIDVSDMVVDFGDRVVSRDPLSRISYFLETTLKNVGRVGVSYNIRELEEVTKEFGGAGVQDRGLSAMQGQNSAVDALMSDIGKQIFFVSPLKGDLAPGTSAPIRVTFQPQSSGDYTKKLEIYVTGQPDPTRPYMTILCQGSGVFPRITFSKQHVQLPTVPLGITSRTWFTIVNNGYSSLRMNYKVSPNIPVPIEVTYPDGDEIGIMVDKIRVFVGAKSETPISWTGKIEFYDQDGERFFISISGCADGCLLTNYPFIRDYLSDYGFIGLDDQPIRFLKKTEIAELRIQEAKRKEELRKLRSLERLKAVESKAASDSAASGKNAKSPRKGDGSGNSVAVEKKVEGTMHETIEYDKITGRYEIAVFHFHVYLK
eukprot:gene18566-18851_t